MLDRPAESLRTFSTIGFPQSRRGKTNAAIAFGAIVLVVVLSITVPHFTRLRNVLAISEQLSFLGFLSIGMTFVMVSGGIDLSSYTVVSAAAVVGATAMASGTSPLLSCALMIVVGIGFGTVNGVAIAWGRMIPFIVTLSTMVLAQGFAIWYTHAESVSDLPSGYVNAISGRLVGLIPVPAIIIIGVAVIAEFVLSRTQFGRWVYLIGTNEHTARISGIPVALTQFFTYVFSGLMAAVTAMVLTAVLGTATTAMVQDDRLLDIIATTVIGGAGLAGGTGSVAGTMLGLLFLTVLDNAFNLLGVPPFIGMTIKGFILVGVIGLDVVRSG